MLNVAAIAVRAHARTRERTPAPAPAQVRAHPRAHSRTAHPQRQSRGLQELRRSNPAGGDCTAWRLPLGADIDCGPWLRNDPTAGPVLRTAPKRCEHCGSCRGQARECPLGGLGRGLHLGDPLARGLPERALGERARTLRAQARVSRLSSYRLRRRNAGPLPVDSCTILSPPKVSKFRLTRVNPN